MTMNIFVNTHNIPIFLSSILLGWNFLFWNFHYFIQICCFALTWFQRSLPIQNINIFFVIIMWLWYLISSDVKFNLLIILKYLLWSWFEWGLLTLKSISIRIENWIIIFKNSIILHGCNRSRLFSLSWINICSINTWTQWLYFIILFCVSLMVYIVIQ